MTSRNAGVKSAAAPATRNAEVGTSVAFRWLFRMVSMERDRFSRSSGDKIKADLAVPQSQFCSAQAEESLF